MDETFWDEFTKPAQELFPNAKDAVIREFRKLLKAKVKACRSNEIKGVVIKTGLRSNKYEMRCCS
jgi:hypothetical protein